MMYYKVVLLVLNKDVCDILSAINAKIVENEVTKTKKRTHNQCIIKFLISCIIEAADKFEGKLIVRD